MDTCLGNNEVLVRECSNYRHAWTLWNLRSLGVTHSAILRKDIHYPMMILQLSYIYTIVLTTYVANGFITYHIATWSRWPVKSKGSSVSLGPLWTGVANPSLHASVSLLSELSLLALETSLSWVTSISIKSRGSYITCTTLISNANSNRQWCYL